MPIKKFILSYRQAACIAKSTRHVSCPWASEPSESDCRSLCTEARPCGRSRWRGCSTEFRWRGNRSASCRVRRHSAWPQRTLRHRRRSRRCIRKAHRHVQLSRARSAAKRFHSTRSHCNGFECPRLSCHSSASLSTAVGRLELRKRRSRLHRRGRPGWLAF